MINLNKFFPFFFILSTSRGSYQQMGCCGEGLNIKKSSIDFAKFLLFFLVDSGFLIFSILILFLN